MVNQPTSKLTSVLLGNILKSLGLTISVAESCTGGMVTQMITSVAGSSAWFDRGFITYSNAAKIEMLGVSLSTLTQFGAVSEQTAIEMALGALKHSHADLSVSITGIAGPDGGSNEKPVGTVCFAWVSKKSSVRSSTQHFDGDRERIRQQSCDFIIKSLISELSQH